MNLSKYLSKAIYCVLALLMTSPVTAQRANTVFIGNPSEPLYTGGMYLERDATGNQSFNSPTIHFLPHHL